VLKVYWRQWCASDFEGAINTACAEVLLDISQQRLISFGGPIALERLGAAAIVSLVLDRHGRDGLKLTQYLDCNTSLGPMIHQRL